MKIRCERKGLESISPETCSADEAARRTHVVAARHETNWLYMREGGAIAQVVAVPREGRAMSVASGIYAGGKKRSG